MTRHLAKISFLAVLGFAPLAQAQEDDRNGLHLSLGAAGVYRAEYKGSKDYEAVVLPFPGLRYQRGDLYVALEGRSLRANLLPGGGLEAGPLLSFERGRDDDIKNLTVRRLGQIDDAISAGIFVRKRFAIGEGALRVGGEVLTDTGDVYGGVFGRAGLDYDRPVGDRWTLSTGLSATYGDRKYMQTYFGISTAGAAASGLAAYRAKAGIETVELSAAARYRISDRWSLVARGGYGRLLHSAADSPIVAKVGSADQGSFVAALFYSF